MIATVTFLLLCAGAWGLVSYAREDCFSGLYPSRRPGPRHIG